MKELESNVARVVPSERKTSARLGRACCTWESCWRTCAREGCELSVGKRACHHQGRQRRHNGADQYLVIDVPPNSVGSVMELVGNRRAECLKA